MVHRVAEYEFLVLELQKCRELSGAYQVAEKGSGGGVGGDSRRKDETAPPSWGDDGAGGLGEDGIGVNVAATGERVSAGGAQQVAPAFSQAQFADEIGEQIPVGRYVAGSQSLDQLFAGGGVGRLGDLWAAD